MAQGKVDTGTNDLIFDIDDGVATLTLNRPERRNAFSGAMISALATALDRCESDPDVAVVVVTGAGGAFCAGGDVKGMADGSGGGSVARAGSDIDSRIHAQRLNQRGTSGRLFRMPKPTIASLPGAAAGAGFSLALSCDLRIAAENAVLTTAFARVGFSGDYGGTYFLTQLVGSAKARELYYLSDRIDAKEAHRLGLFNWVVPADRLATETALIAYRIAKGPRVAYRYMKENLNRAMAGEFEDCIDLEATHHVHCGATEDHREAARAFVEKREPVFKGR